MRSQRFTLIEMLIVISLAMVLMGLGASAFTNLSHTQKLTIGGGAVNGALQQARAHALKTKKVTSVIFLDGGINNTNASETVDENYLRDTKKLETPYEVVVWEWEDNKSDCNEGNEIARVKLPEGIVWMDTGCYHTASKYGFDFSEEKRNCSLIINFSPTGSAWADIATSGGGFVAYDSGNGVRSRQSCEAIRIFNIDDLQNFSSNAHDLVYVGNGSKGDSGKYYNRPIANTSVTDFLEYKNPMTWQTVRVNYLTGLSELINGQKEFQYKSVTEEH